MVRARDCAQSFDKCRRVWKGDKVLHLDRILGAQVCVFIEKLLETRLAVYKYIGSKDEVVDALNLHGDVLFFHTQHFRKSGNHIHRDIAKTEGFLEISVTENSFCHHACRVGEVDQPCVWAEFLDILYNVKDDRNRTECFEHTACAVCLLSNHAVA